LIAKGSHGSVYECLLLTTGKLMAVKTVIIVKKI